MSGCRIVYDRLPAVSAELAPRVGQVVRATCLRIEARAKLSMSGAKHGRAYQRGRIGRKMNTGYRAAGLESYTTRNGTEMAIVGYRYHRASAPGEAPAIDTGYLVNSLQTKMLGPTLGMVYTNARYAGRLEFRLGRAFLRPAADLEREAHQTAIAQVLRGIG